MSGNPDLDTTAKRSGLRMGHSRRHHTAVRNPVKWSAHQNPRPVLARSPEWWGHSSRSNRGSDWGRRRYWSVVGGGCKVVHFGVGPAPWSKRVSGRSAGEHREDCALRARALREREGVRLCAPPCRTKCARSSNAGALTEAPQVHGQWPSPPSACGRARAPTCS